jgi:uncharacterized membrane protein YciS (DUF1049 family)
VPKFLIGLSEELSKLYFNFGFYFHFGPLLRQGHWWLIISVFETNFLNDSMSTFLICLFPLSLALVVLGMTLYHAYLWVQTSRLKKKVKKRRKEYLDVIERNLQLIEKRLQLLKEIRRKEQSGWYDLIRSAIKHKN